MNISAYSHEDGWKVVETVFDASEASSRATVFALANGYMGLRGAGEEVAPDLDGLKGCYINGIYDTPRGELTEREFPNVPDWTLIELSVDGESFDLSQGEVLEYRRELDMQMGLMRRRVKWRSPSDKVVVIDSERYVSMVRKHIGGIRYNVTVEQACNLEIACEVDSRVNNRWADHVKNTRVESDRHVQYVEIDTFDPGYTIGVYTVTGVRTTEPPSESSHSNWTDSHRAVGVYRCRLEATQSITLVKLAALHDSRFTQGSIREACGNDAEGAFQAGYGTLKDEHIKRWEELWSHSDVVIEGDELAQIGMRFSLFHLLGAAPYDNDKVSIPARGLQGQDYYGSIFWDCEIFVFPFFAYTQPQVARNLLGYRIETLPGAKRKAENFGWKGAYYAWQSQETGDEQCDLYVFTNPLTGEKIRSYFADEQIHISSDIAHAINQYIDATGDESLWTSGGAQVLFEIARFFASRVTWVDSRYEILSVLGPDEYHERIDNNAFTNAFAAETLRRAISLWAELTIDSTVDHSNLRGFEKAEVSRWQEILEKLYVPSPDASTRIIEQFDGYLKLKDEPVAETNARLAHPDLHKGGPGGPFQETQNIKQADVIMLLYLMRDRYDEWTKKANWEYYEPRTAHDSSLSPMAYSLVAADVGMVDWAYKYFIYTAHIDLEASGPHWNMGIHAASLGGAWLAVVHGFCRLILTADGPCLLSWPLLPSGWKQVKIPFVWHGVPLTLSVTPGKIVLESSGDKAVKVRLPDGPHDLPAGGQLEQSF
jgi:trehalose/maltose hydrolase-like predicted phosphorylase